MHAFTASASSRSYSSAASPSGQNRFSRSSSVPLVGSVYHGKSPATSASTPCARATAAGVKRGWSSDEHGFASRKRQRCQVLDRSLGRKLPSPVVRYLRHAPAQVAAGVERDSRVASVHGERLDLVRPRESQVASAAKRAAPAKWPASPSKRFGVLSAGSAPLGAVCSSALAGGLSSSSSSGVASVSGVSPSSISSGVPVRRSGRIAARRLGSRGVAGGPATGGSSGSAGSAASGAASVSSLAAGSVSSLSAGPVSPSSGAAGPVTSVSGVGAATALGTAEQPEAVEGPYATAPSADPTNPERIIASLKAIETDHLVGFEAIEAMGNSVRHRTDAADWMTRFYVQQRSAQAMSLLAVRIMDRYLAVRRIDELEAIYREVGVAAVYIAAHMTNDGATALSSFVKSAR